VASNSNTTPTRADAPSCARSASTRDYTPFGYLRNPGHRAHSWAAVEGGNLRAASDWLGVGWVYPLQRDPTAGAGIAIESSVDGRAARSRAEFDALGLTSGYHSALILGFDWHSGGVVVEARYFLVDDDALGVRVRLTNTHRNAHKIDITLALRTWGSPPLAHVFASSAAPSEIELEPGASRLVVAVLARGDSEQGARARATAALQTVEARFAQLRAQDDAFARTCPRLTGDWPSGWREGLHYDFQTTRLLVQPRGGIFGDVWPAWMVAWPRVVLAEGALDMLRLACADPALAQRAVLSMFRAAPQPNVPCVFEDGSYNMVAADGSRCGTSPAWCLPFLSLELLYLRTLDRDWLRELYPYLQAYLDWWLAERVDAQGWVVYKCTWESGEDGNPRLDPTGSGDAVIERRVRPVELQATMAHAARVMRFFAHELGRDDDRPRWRRVEATYRRRTRALFDVQTGRYRDWLVDEERFQPERPDRLYWGVDTGRFSPLGLTPLLIDEPLSLDEVWLHASPPWTLWPSWTYVLVESAAAGGAGAAVGGLVAEIIGRVYRVTTRRELGSLARPLPGAAPEFWPEDWRTYQGHDGYGWGATTANLLIRHLFGFQESRDTRGWSVDLAPGFPPTFLSEGHRFGIRKLNYRGLVVDLTYRVAGEHLEVEVRLGALERRCRVRERRGRRVYTSRRARRVHTFAVQNGRVYRLDLD
jgi:Mannosylglycerate hydrolase MGH1-like glycoside hydrolase domain